MLFSDLQKIWTEWCDTFSGFGVGKTIWEFQNMPRLPRPYISLMINGITQFGFNEIRGPDDNGIAEIVAQSRLVLRINAYGENKKEGFDAFDALETLKLSVDAVAAQKIFDDNISFYAVLSDNNLAQQINTGFEGRASMDTSWALATSITDDVGLIEHVIANGNITNYNDEIIKQVTVEV